MRRAPQTPHVPWRTFLLPSVKARRRIDPILLACVGDVGLASLPDRALVVCELDDDCDAERLRPSSARMSSRETLR
jgi:hypothetical protein